MDGGGEGGNLVDICPITILTRADDGEDFLCCLSSSICSLASGSALDQAILASSCRCAFLDSKSSMSSNVTDGACKEKEKTEMAV